MFHEFLSAQEKKKRKENKSKQSALCCGQMEIMVNQHNGVSADISPRCESTTCPQLWDAECRAEHAAEMHWFCWFPASVCSCCMPDNGISCSFSLLNTGIPNSVTGGFCSAFKRNTCCALLLCCTRIDVVSGCPGFYTGREINCLNENIKHGMS